MLKMSVGGGVRCVIVFQLCRCVMCGIVSHMNWRCGGGGLVLTRSLGGACDEF